MLRMYLCKKCQSVYSVEEWESRDCRKCGEPLTSLGISDNNWAKLDANQRRSIIAGELTTPEPGDLPSNTPTMSQERKDSINSRDALSQSNTLEEIRTDIHSIRNIMIFYLVISIIGAIVFLVSILA